MGSNPGCDRGAYVLEQDTQLLLFTQLYKWVSVRVHGDIVFEKAAESVR